jgi:hypothetical protein
MEFLKAITQNEDPFTEQEISDLLDDIDILDEDAFDRIEARVKGREIALYRYLIGTTKFAQIKRFVEYAEQGKTIPADAVKAFAPAIEMLDDIVSAGPSFILALRNLHNRAKKKR